MKKSNKKQSSKRTIVPLAQKLTLAIHSGKGNTVSFVMEDGSKTVQQLSASFLKGKTINMIIADLKAIQHDLNAKYFTI